MVLNILIISYFLQNQAENVFEGVFFIWSHVTAYPLIPLIQDPLKAGIDFASLVHGKADWSHFQIDWKLIGLLLAFLGVLKLHKIVVLTFQESDDALWKSKYNINSYMMFLVSSKIL